MAWLVALVLFAQSQFNAYATDAPLHTAPEVLQLAIHALENVHSMQYEVRLLPGGGAKFDTTLMAGRIKVTGTVGSPIQYRAEFHADDPPTVVLAVSNGDVVRVSDGGAVHEAPTRTIEDYGSSGALPTLQLFDAARYRQALVSKNAIYAGQDDIEGDLCYVIAVAGLLKDEVGSDTFYYWISAKTGLPRSRQTFRILHGKTLTTYRWIVSNIVLNPEIADDAFRYHPTAADSTVAAPVKISLPNAVSTTALTGTQIPELEARDVDYKPVSLARVSGGKATIITLWATWCGPCVAEMPALQKLVERYPGKLQVIALSVNDSRLAALNFIGKHPEYRFTYLTDPNIEDEHSKIAQFFVGDGVPRNAFAGADGKIADYVLGSYASREDDLFKKVERWLLADHQDRK